MNAKDIIRAWKDSEYLHSLPAEQRAQLPENPVGMVLSSEELASVGGAGTVWTLTTTFTVVPGTETTATTTTTTVR
jgi:mersacidin/lichenicidin family type 2 lantibiotic